MGSILAAVTSGGIKDLVLGVLDRIHVSPTVQAQIKEQMEQNAVELQKMDLALQQKELDAASQNIQAEAKSGPFAASARPMFLYMMEFILVCNFVIFPLIQRSPIALPEPIFWLFGSCMLGYTGARTWEKIQGKL